MRGGLGAVPTVTLKKTVELGTLVGTYEGRVGGGTVY
jgi:hypothetical protein